MTNSDIAGTLERLAAWVGDVTIRDDEPLPIEAGKLRVLIALISAQEAEINGLNEQLEKVL